jgi:hypothetical protein
MHQPHRPAFVRDQHCAPSRQLADGEPGTGDSDFGLVQARRQFLACLSEEIRSLPPNVLKLAQPGALKRRSGPVGEILQPRRVLFTEPVRLGGSDGKNAGYPTVDDQRKCDQRKRGIGERPDRPAPV